MAGQSLTLTAEFPRSLRGYSTIAVDDFVRQMGTRLDSLQQWTEAQAAKIERLTAQAQSAERNLSAFMEKELAIANAFVVIEQQRLAAEQEIELARENARIEIDEMLAEARREAAAVVAEAQREAEGVREEAEARRLAAEERVRALQAEYDATVSTIRRTLEAELALLGDQASVVQMTHAAVAACEPGRSELCEAAA
jgi:cell division septum initiation protein DivIVA